MRFKSSYFRSKKKAFLATCILLIFVSDSTASHGVKDAGWTDRLQSVYKMVEEIDWTVVMVKNAEAHDEGAARTSREAHEGQAQTSWEPKWLDPVTATDFHLQDQEGNEVTLSGFYGKVVLISFIYSTCQQSCPLIAKELGKVQRHIALSMGSDVVFLSITLDPERDTQEVLKEWGRSMGADFSSWKFLTGSSSEIQTVLDAYRVFYERGQGSDGDDIAHSNPIYLIDQWGRVRKKMAPAFFTYRGEEYILHLIEEGKSHH